jgi:hypothetical protein
MKKELFNKIRSYNTYPCVTIILPTHRTSPDNKQDSIRLKNLITETHTRLSEEFSKRDLTGLEKNLERISEIDHNFNKEGLVIFINDEIFEYERLLFTPEERVIIDETFATRDIIRAMHKAENYYVLMLSRQKVRLFEGYLTQVHEINNADFPISNDTLYETSAEMRSVSHREDDLIEEFFNRADKSFKEVYADNPASVILMGVDRNITHYTTICDTPSMIIGGIPTGGDDAAAHEVAQLAWPVAREFFAQRSVEAIETLERSISENKFESDIQLIYKAITEGRGDTLYTESTFFQPAIVDNGKISLVDDSKLPGVTDDIVDELAELTLQFGGKVVFCEDGALEKYQRIALVTRY